MAEDAPDFEHALHMFFGWCDSMEDTVEIFQWSSSDQRQILKPESTAQDLATCSTWPVLGSVHDWNEIGRRKCTYEEETQRQVDYLEAKLY